MQLTQKVRIFPTAEQISVFWKLSEKCRLIYNFALAERREAWKNGLKGINYRKQQNDLPKIKEKHPEYGWVYSKVLQMVLRGLAGDYKSFFVLRRNGDKNAEPPRFKGKEYFTAMAYNQSGFKVEKGKVTLVQYCSEAPLEFSIPLKFEFSKVCQVTLFRDDDDFYVSITYEKTGKPYFDNGLYQAVDLGITNIVTAVNSHGEFLEIRNPRPDRYWQPKIEEVQSKRDYCRKGSNRWRWYHGKLRKMRRKCSNQTRDFQHKLSRKLVENTRANTIVIGDLNVKGMAQSSNVSGYLRKGLNRATQNNGYLSRFAGFLTYKAELVGKRVIEISEEGTTKTCCVCGRKHDMKIWDRTMKCDCGNGLKRDRNSCVNIMVRFLSQNASVDGLFSFRESILRQTGLTIEAVSYSQEALSFRIG